MSNIDRSITTTEVIPVIESAIFAGREDAQFAIGMLATGTEVLPGREDEYLGYLRLRAKVYADETQMIDKGLVRPDGTETDEDDERSVHFGIIENRGMDTRVVAAMRLIVKDSVEDRPLPIEDFFPEAFEGNPAGPLSNEASRYICRHENKRIQAELTWPLFAMNIAHINAHGLESTYGVIEPFLASKFKAVRVPFTKIAEPKFVEEYSDENLGVQIHTDKLGHLVGRANPGMLIAMSGALATNQMYYFGQRAPMVPAPRGSEVTEIPPQAVGMA